MIALDVVRALHAHTTRAGVPGPAALIGEWADADAVIAPSIRLRPGAGPPDRPDEYWFGSIAFPAHDAAATAPDVIGGFSDGVLMLRDGVWSWTSVTGIPCPPWVSECLDAAAGGRAARARPWSAQWTAPDKAPHVAGVRSCLDAITAGEVYQACVCTRFTGRLTGAPIDFFSDIAESTAPTKTAWLESDRGAIASFSPESFLDRRADHVTSSPIKGTIAAHAEPGALSGSVKDIAENVMIVDLVRNDLGRVAATGSVHVRDLLTLMPAPGVWHLVSTVGADLLPGVGNDTLLEAAFPPASVTGTPKIRALELLAAWEDHDRGAYCGAIGVAGPDGLLDLSVAIRTVTAESDGVLTLGVGGGITIDSDPDTEWQECLDKAAAIVSATAATQAPAPTPPASR
ncbi:aminodeoxychorismate synthase component I [Gordonia zhaorongruii]|uniref:aminodeoxychorismate synthase component I n=1 Tax=Gordonia zhaorongruii TaxID=2597659 RepID=UPI001048CABA|nr:aminodeoxychorismate synthase component I [Gordonia zhaorongruii]